MTSCVCLTRPCPSSTRQCCGRTLRSARGAGGSEHRIPVAAVDRNECSIAGRHRVLKGIVSWTVDRTPTRGRHRANMAETDAGEPASQTIVGGAVDEASPFRVVRPGRRCFFSGSSQHSGRIAPSSPLHLRAIVGTYARVSVTGQRGGWLC